MRARSLLYAPWHREECLSAATAVAQRERDTQLLAEVRGASAGLRPRADAASAEEVDQILSREAAAWDYPLRDIAAPGGVVPCQCPACRASSGQRTPEDESAEDDEFDDLDLDIEPGLPPEMARLPPKLLALFMEMAARFGDIEPEDVAQRDPAFFEKMERAIDEHVMKGGALPGMGRHRRRPKRRRRR